MNIIDGLSPDQLAQLKGQAIAQASAAVLQAKIQTIQATAGLEAAERARRDTAALFDPATPVIDRSPTE